jgi:hypothetical protein
MPLLKVRKPSRAERVGFEPTKACTLPAFQASAISQTRRPLRMHARMQRKGWDSNPRGLLTLVVFETTALGL